MRHWLFHPLYMGAFSPQALDVTELAYPWRVFTPSRRRERR